MLTSAHEIAKKNIQMNQHEGLEFKETKNKKTFTTWKLKRNLHKLLLQPLYRLKTRTPFFVCFCLNWKEHWNYTLNIGGLHWNLENREEREQKKSMMMLNVSVPRKIVSKVNKMSRSQSKSHTYVRSFLNRKRWKWQVNCL